MLKKRLFGIMILIVGIMLVFSFVSCNLIGPINGTWEWTDVNTGGYLQYKFSGSNYEYTNEYFQTGKGRFKGTFSIDSEKTKLTLTQTHQWNSNKSAWEERMDRETWSIIISGNSLQINRRPFTKK
jgi:hypothetical protein